MEKVEKVGSINYLADKYIETRSERDFCNLFERVQPGLINHVNNMLKDLDASNDVVADAFIKMWQKIDTYDPKWCFSTWAYRIAYNEAMQYIRKNKNMMSLDTHAKFIGTPPDEMDSKLERNGVELTDLISQPDEFDPVQTAEDVAEALYNSVREQMDKLPAHYKDIIIDREVNEMQYDEIAAKYGLELNTVKTRIIRAREKIMVMANLGERKSKKKARKKKESAV